MANSNAVVWICVTFLMCFRHFAECNHWPALTKITLRRANATGAESMTFDPTGEGPYVGVLDGRVLKYEGHEIGFVPYATTAPGRNKATCENPSGVADGATCGRPAGMAFNFFTGDLYIADNYFGFQVVAPTGGQGIQLATSFNGTKFAFTDALDIDQPTQTVYFTDAGAIFQNQNLTDILKSRDQTGRVFKYNIKTARLMEIHSRMAGPTGLAVSRDGSYLVVSEFIKNRIRRIWLRGPRKYQADTLVRLPGSPDNIKRTVTGDFWVAVTVQQPAPLQTVSSLGIKFNGFGRILESLDFTVRYNGTMISEVNEWYRKLYIASPMPTSNYIGFYGYRWRI